MFTALNQRKDMMNESSTMSFDVTRRSVSEETFREFYCSARRVPDDILRKTLNQMGGRWEFLDTKDVANALYNEGLLTYNEFCKLTNVYVDQQDRTSDLLYKILPAKGNEQNTLVTFYHCLLRCHFNRDLLTELRAHALKICGVDRPVLVPGITASDEILQQMLGKLSACVPAEQAKKFAKSLDLNGNDLPDSPHIQLSQLCQLWIARKHHECIPEALVEALVCTEGLGKYASGIGAPTNPPDVESYFYHLQNKWWNMAAFLGYSKDDLDAVITEPDNSVQRQIAKFLAIFKMPDCGACTITILHKAGGKAGITSQSKREHFGLQWNSFPGMKGMACGVSMPMLETFEDEPKPKAATASPPQMKPHGAAPPGHVWPWNIPPTSWAAAVHLASVLPPPPWCSVHCHSPFQGQMPSYGYPPVPEFLQTLVAQVQSLSEWKQAQCRDGDGCGDLCEQAIATSKQAEEVHASATINTIPDAEHESSANATQNVPGSATAGTTVVTTENEIPSDGSKDLLTYCRKGDPDDIEIVAALLDSGASLKVQTEDDGSYPLHVAVLSKSYQMLSLLVPYYDSLDMIDVVRHDHKTALMLACKEKNYDFVRLLVEHTADVNTKDCAGFSCLHLKETLESPDIVQLLIDKGADVDNPTDGNNLTPLTHACVLGLTQSIEILLSSGACPDGLPRAASTPLCAAAEADHSNVVQILLERKANINLQDQDGFTPLLRACKAGHVGIASKLINANADKDRADKDGNTPVLVAVDTNNTELLQLLVACGANVNQFKVIFSGDTEFEVTPLILAAGRGKLDIVEILVENKANVNYSSRYTVSALTYAVRGGHAHVVEYLLKVNDMIRTIDVLYAPLLVAVRSEENYILKLLLDALGGYEKALRDATDTGAQDLVEALSQLDEMGRPKQPEMGDRSSVANSATLQHLNPRHLHECMDRILVEVTKAAVKTAERKLGRRSLVDEARKSGYEHIVCFFEQFFASPDVGPEMFLEFINMTPCPSPAIFTFENKMTFDGGTFKTILDEMNSDAIEYLPMALMQIPGFEDTCLDGEGLMQLLFGKRFFETVQCLNLLEAAKPSLQSEHGATRPTQDQTRECLQHDHSGDSDHDNRLLTHRNRADEYELQDVEIDHDSYLSTHRDREDKHELQDVESPVETLSVESHSQSKEPAVEQQDQLSEESELDHQVQPVLRTDSACDQVAYAGQTGQERTDKLKVSRATSLPTATKTRRPTNPNTGSVRKSRIPRRVGIKHCNPHVSMPLRSASEGDEPYSHTSIPAHELAQQCRMPNSARKGQNEVCSKASRDKDVNKVSPNTEPATNATARSRHFEQRGSASIPVRRVCGMNIHDTPITNSELLRVYSRRVVDWKSLAKYLKVDEREINRINHHYKLDEERCCQMLHSWLRTEGNHATYARLAKGFEEIGQEYLIKDLQKHLKDIGSHEAPMMDNEIEIDLSQETWGAEITQLTLWLNEKRAEGFTAARIQIKLEQ